MVLQFSPCEVSLAACLEEGTGEGLVGTHLQVGRQLAAGEAGQLTHVRTHHREVLAGLKVGGKATWCMYVYWGGGGGANTVTWTKMADDCLTDKHNT